LTPFSQVARQDPLFEGFFLSASARRPKAWENNDNVVEVGSQSDCTDLKKSGLTRDKNQGCHNTWPTNFCSSDVARLLDSDCQSPSPPSPPFESSELPLQRQAFSKRSKGQVMICGGALLPQITATTSAEATSLWYDYISICPKRLGLLLRTVI